MSKYSNFIVLSKGLDDIKTLVLVTKKGLFFSHSEACSKHSYSIGWYNESTQEFASGELQDYLNLEFNKFLLEQKISNLSKRVKELELAVFKV